MKILMSSILEEQQQKPNKNKKGEVEFSLDPIL
jgi:hypothetical protein